MIYLIAIIVAIIGIVVIERYDYDGLGVPIVVVDVICAAVMTLILINGHIGVDEQHKLLQDQQAYIEYKLDNGINTNILEIRDWNKEVLLNQAHQRNFWTGIFVPNIYDGLETIEYSRLHQSEE